MKNWPSNFTRDIRVFILIAGAEAYAEAEHLARLAAGKSITIPADVRDLYARGSAGEISSDAIVASIVARYSAED